MDGRWQQRLLIPVAKGLLWQLQACQFVRLMFRVLFSRFRNWWPRRRAKGIGEGYL